MSTISSATHAQTFKQNSNGLLLVALIGLGAFFFYAVQNHLITDGFIIFMSLFFDMFSVKSSSIIPDLIILLLAALSFFGLFCLFRFFLPVGIDKDLLAEIDQLKLENEKMRSCDNDIVKALILENEKLKNQQQTAQKGKKIA